MPERHFHPVHPQPPWFHFPEGFRGDATQGSLDPEQVRDGVRRRLKRRYGVDYDVEFSLGGPLSPIRGIPVLDDMDFLAGYSKRFNSYAFQLYIGPKDKSTFDKDPLYRQLGFVNTIDFQGCCCPTSIINPLAFGILAIMKWMHVLWPHNYGIVIIVLVTIIIVDNVRVWMGLLKTEKPIGMNTEREIIYCPLVPADRPPDDKTLA